jgi:hypothetical protein
VVNSGSVNNIVGFFENHTYFGCWIIILVWICFCDISPAIWSLICFISWETNNIWILHVATSQIIRNGTWFRLRCYEIFSWKLFWSLFRKLFFACGLGIHFLFYRKKLYWLNVGFKCNKKLEVWWKK